jgi:hypothetical protein
MTFSEMCLLSLFPSLFHSTWRLDSGPWGLLGRRFTTWATPPAHFCFSCFSDRVLHFCPGCPWTAILLSMPFFSYIFLCSALSSEAQSSFRTFDLCKIFSLSIFKSETLLWLLSKFTCVVIGHLYNQRAMWCEQLTIQSPVS